MRLGRVLLAVPLLGFFAQRAMAFELSQDVAIDGYADVRLIAPPDSTSWLKDGLGKLRFGPQRGNLRFVEGIAQVDAALEDDLNLLVVARAEPDQRSGIDALEAYLSYQPLGDGDISWSAKAGAFFPTISFENDDLGWTSPYTLTPSAINSWIGEEMRTIGSEAIAKWRTGLGTFSAMGALFCCNDPNGILLADRGWSMNDRPTGLFERVPLPDASEKLFHAPYPARTAEFAEIDGRIGWYAGLGWQSGLGKIAVVRYDNQGDDEARTARDTAWNTKFWSLAARTQLGPVILIAQGMTGATGVEPRPGLDVYTDYQSAFLLASYDIGDWRLSMREDAFQTRREGTPASPMSEDGHAITMAASWSPQGWLRLTGEWIGMQSRRGEYLLDGLPGAQRTDNQLQFSARVFF